MTRNISFALTTKQFLDGSKTVTRRMGWENLRPGDVLYAVEKSQGLKKGETVRRLGLIRVVTARREKLFRMQMDVRYGREECHHEGFPGMDPHEFVRFFCNSHKGCRPASLVTRIEFERLANSPPDMTESGR
jgi:hypothetical protein